MKAEKLGVGDGDRLDGDGIDIWGGDIRLDSGILLKFKKLSQHNGILELY